MSSCNEKSCTNDGDIGGLLITIGLIFFVTGCILPGYPVYALVWLVASNAILALYQATKCEE